MNYKKLHRDELISALFVLFVDQKNDSKLQLFLKLVDKYFALFVLCCRPVPHRWSEVAVVGGEVGDGQGEDEEVRRGQLPHRLLLIRQHHHHRGLRIRSVQPQPQPSSMFAHTHTYPFFDFSTLEDVAGENIDLRYNVELSVHITFCSDFLNESYEIFVLGVVFFLPTNFDFLTSPFWRNFVISFKMYCSPELKFEKIFHLWSFS